MAKVETPCKRSLCGLKNDMAGSPAKTKEKKKKTSFDKETGRTSLLLSFIILRSLGAAAGDAAAAAAGLSKDRNVDG